MKSAGFLSLVRQAVLSLLIGGLLFSAVLSVTFIGLQVIYAGRIFPGVQVGQLDLGGQLVSQAMLSLTQGEVIGRLSSIQLQFQGKIWSVTPAQIGINFDAGATLLNAYAVGRSGSIDRRLGDLVGIFSAKHPIAPVFVFNQNTAYLFLENLSRQINRPAREAELVVKGTQIIAKPGQSGYSLDIPATIERISDSLLTDNLSIIPLIVTESQPELMDASEFAAAAQSILSSPLILTADPDEISSGKTWKFSPTELAAMLSFERVKSNGKTTYEVKINESIMTNALKSISESVNRQAENPRFSFNDNTRRLELIQAGVIGRSLNIARSLSAIQTGLRNGLHSIPLEFDIYQPAVKNDASGDQLGIRELLHSEVSYFYGSSKERIQNIRTAARQFHGLLVAPGEKFSMAQAMGEISLNNGYAEALIIFNGQTIQGVGGGVCQVSTTLFRAAFFSGFPINERHPHAYRVKYYEKENGNRINSQLAGLDATVYVPLVDLKFTNDTPYWLLMETYVSPQNNSLTWKFYSTHDGRSVQWTSSGPTNLVEPPKPVYRENTSLKKGEIKQVDWEAQGADIFITRRVYNADNQLRFQDSFSTHYEPWRAVYEYGPGTEGIPQTETP